MSQHKRLLILACSQKKRKDKELLPAIERYDGPIFRVLRKYLNNQDENKPDVFILSAKFGLITDNYQTPFYDYKMTKHRACELRPEVTDKLVKIVEKSRYSQLFINLGKTYWTALEGLQQKLPESLSITISQGSQGGRQSLLRAWLYDGLPESNQQNGLLRKNVKLRGVEITINREAIFALAKKALSQDRKLSDAYQSWYVVIDDQPVSPKWLVSIVTGLPVSAFHSGDARRVLQQLGIEVKQI